MQPSTTRRRLLAATGAAATGLAGCTDGANQVGEDGTDDGVDGTGADGAGGAGGTGDGSDDGSGDPLADLPDGVALEPVATGLDAPVAFASSPVHDLRYVLEQGGTVRAIGPDGPLEEPVLDLTDAVTTGYEMGLLGVALHPTYEDTRRLFLRYSSPPREGTPSGYSHTFVVAEFVASEDGESVDPDSERTVLEIPQPQGNHNAGDLAFGPDGFLYVPTGDGGAAADQGEGHVESWYDDVPGGNGQNVTENLLGGVLRIDVDAEPTEHPRTDDAAPASPDGEAGYAIPEDNPLVGRDGLDEYYAWGLRNPWQLSFDPPASDAIGGSSDQESDGRGDCYVADVGQSDYEEVNLLEAGANYGWNVREGAHCFGASDCPTETPDDVRGGEPLVDPIVEYSQSGGEVSGVSVIGGHVYRGDAVPGLEGAYVFGDLEPGGRLFASRPPDGDGTWPVATIDVSGASIDALYSFGRGGDGTLYALGQGGEGGGVWRLAPVE